MCGFITFLHNDDERCLGRCHALAISADRIKHRGPDYTSNVMFSDICGYHNRLAIVDETSGPQPFYTDTSVLFVNGEIYNHLELRAQYTDYPYKSNSDCEVLMPMLDSVSSIEEAIDIISRLDGVFAFVYYNRSKSFEIVARDALGVVPLYYAHTTFNDGMYIGSEVKTLCDLDDVCIVHEFAAGRVLFDGLMGDWYRTLDKPMGHEQVDTVKLRSLVQQAVTKRLMGDRPVGIVLSGGLDSSIVAACARAKLEEVHTFSVGVEGSEDLARAQQVADHLGTVHHELIVTPAQIIEAIPRAVWHLETFDVATVRSGVVMMLLAEYIHSHGFKSVLGGDGADELFAGYAYFAYAPSVIELHAETTRKLKGLSTYDCLRGNKSMMAASVEYRCPLLDKALVEYVHTRVDPINLEHPDPEMGQVEQLDGPVSVEANIEKRILRRAFADALPYDIVWRRKVQFSDGAGVIPTLQSHALTIVNDTDFERRHKQYPTLTPESREALWYRRVWSTVFNDGCLPCVSYYPSLNCSSDKVYHWFPQRILANMDPCGVKYSV